jgi:hypothetical protein
MARFYWIRYTCFETGGSVPISIQLLGAGIPKSRYRMGMGGMQVELPEDLWQLDIDFVSNIMRPTDAENFALFTGLSKTKRHAM